MYRCESCDHLFAEAQLRRLELPPPSARHLLLCPDCGRAVAAEVSHASRPFGRAMLSALRYPLQPRGAPPLVGLLLTIWAFTWIPGLGFYLAMAVVFGYLFTIVRQTARGRDELPGHEDVGDLFGLLGPLAATAFATLVSFLPALVLRHWLGGSPESDGASVAMFFALVLGSLYLPGAIIVAAHGRRWHAPLDPLPVVRLMLRLPGAYLGCALALIAAYVVVTGVSRLLVGAPDFLVVPALVYPLLVAARVLGLLVGEHREELGLERDDGRPAALLD